MSFISVIVLKEELFLFYRCHMTVYVQLFFFFFLQCYHLCIIQKIQEYYYYYYLVISLIDQIMQNYFCDFQAYKIMNIYFTYINVNFVVIQ